MRIIDLSTPLYDAMDVYPGDPQVHITIAHDYPSHNWQLRELSMGSHTGTHVDAPAHMHREAASLDDLPVERFMGLARRVRGSGPYPANRGLIFAEEIKESWVSGIITTAPGFVCGPMSEVIERRLLGQGIITYTDLIRLEEIPTETDVYFIGLPLAIKDGDGSPVRAIAIDFSPAPTAFIGEEADHQLPQD